MAQLKDLATLAINQISSKDFSDFGDISFAFHKQLLENNQVDWDNCSIVDSNLAKIKAVVHKGDIVIVREGLSCGYIFLHTSDKPFITGRACAIVKSSDANLYERLVLKQVEINNLIVGITAPRIFLKSLSELDV